MKLEAKRIGELAMTVLIEKFSEEGLMLRPKETKREFTNVAKKLKVPVAEFATFTKLVLEQVYQRTVKELTILEGKVEE